ncbi:hypothetical protein ACH4OX_24325 [Streptomyces roseolus]|uniref:hypothetical protein n=1 Tax=Streptomyces roseolus TaxID=67358 RepID=UPI0037A41974
MSVAPVSDGMGHRYGPGQVVHVEDVLARSWVAAGHAVIATQAAGNVDGRRRAAAARAAETEQAAEAAPEPRAPKKATAKRAAKKTAARPPAE